MSTDYKLEIEAADGTSTTITVIDSVNPLPGSDTWEADDQSQWGTKGGPVASWGSTTAYLGGPGGGQSIELEGFGKHTKEGEKGKGSKNYEDGSFPEGGFTWRCTSKS